MTRITDYQWKRYDREIDRMSEAEVKDALKQEGRIRARWQTAAEDLLAGRESEEVQLAREWLDWSHG